MTHLSNETDLRSNAANASVLSAGQILEMAAKEKYEAPRVKTHRLDGVVKDGPLAMSGNF